MCFFSRFDYGEKFWVIKHKFFTCHCASEKCRYSRTNITSFLREYYKRNGEPLPPELVPAPNDVKTEGQNAKNKQGSKVKHKTRDDTILNCDKKKLQNNEKMKVENDSKKVQSETKKLQNDKKKLNNKVKVKK